MASNKTKKNMCNKCKAPTFLSRTSNPFQNKVNFSLNMIILKDEYNKHFGLRGRRNILYSICNTETFNFSIYLCESIYFFLIGFCWLDVGMEHRMKSISIY